MRRQEIHGAHGNSVPSLLVLFVVAAGIAHAQARAWHAVQLSYGIRLEVPHDWSTDRAIVASAMQAGQKAIDATTLVVDGESSLITFSGPSFDSNEVSLSILIMPARISEAALVRMSDAEIRAGDENVFRPEAEGMANRHGLRITSWNGTTRRTIGGRHGLLTGYRFTYPNGREIIKETYSIYLGSHSINVHVFRRTNADPRLVSQLSRMLGSLVISVDSL